jgi:hypothetical protein
MRLGDGDAAHDEAFETRDQRVDRPASGHDPFVGPGEINGSTIAPFSTHCSRPGDKFTLTSTGEVAWPNSTLNPCRL